MLRIFKRYHPTRNIFFVLGESLSICLSVVFSHMIILGAKNFEIFSAVVAKTLVATLVCQLFLYYRNLYDISLTESMVELFVRLMQALGLAAFFLGLLCLIFPWLIIGEGVFPLSMGFIIALILSWRFTYRYILNHGLFNQKIIIVGSDGLAFKIITEIEGKKNCGYSISALFTEKLEEIPENFIRRIPTLRSYKNLCTCVDERDIEKIVVALGEKRGNFPIQELLKCRMEGITILEGSTFFEMLTGRLIVEHINPGWLIFSDGFYKSASRRFSKRTFDIIVSLIFLIVLLPLIGLVALLIKLDSKGPVIFFQERVGAKKKPYRLFKFRSMIEDAEKLSGPVWARDNDNRITRVGRIIRKLRFDEIPQLWNVLRGEMSFVGPRPERAFFVDELQKIIPYYEERFTVKPGITGWAQVCYGYGASVEDAVRKLEYDLFYIKNMSTLLDVVILVRTVKTVLFDTGAR